MDKIYSRRRIKLPKIRVSGFNYQKRSLKQKIALNTAMILIIAVLSFVLVIKGITPIIDKVCENAAMAKATVISNNMATEVMKRYDYSDLVTINKDKNRKCNNVTIKYYYNKRDNIRCGSKNTRGTNKQSR